MALDLPALTTAADLAAALGAVAGAVAAGELSPEEGQSVAAIMEAQRRAIETAELERRMRRLTELEGPQAGTDNAHVMIPPGWLPAADYDPWRAAEAAKAPTGALVIAVRFVKSGEADLTREG